MAGQLGNTIADAIYNWLHRNIDMPPAPDTVYLSLHTANPGGTGAGEVSTAAGTGWVGYARVAVTTGTAGTGAGSGFTAPGANGAIRQGENVDELAFPASGGTSGTVVVTHIGAWDAATGGTFLEGVALAASQTIGPNAAGPTIPAGALDFQIAPQP